MNLKKDIFRLGSNMPAEQLHMKLFGVLKVSRSVNLSPFFPCLSIHRLFFQGKMVCHIDLQSDLKQSGSMLLPTEDVSTSSHVRNQKKTILGNKKHDYYFAG